MPIQGLTDRRELPRGGSLRLGAEKEPNKPGAPLDHFRFDPLDERLLPAFQELYGPEPREIVVALHSDDLEEVFSHYYRHWKGQRVWCYGDNETAWRLKPGHSGEREEVACTPACPLRKTSDSERNAREKRYCQPEGWLKVLLPELPTTKLFDVTARATSIRWICTALELLQRTRGQLTDIPLVLSLRPFKAHGATNYGITLEVRQSLVEVVTGEKLGLSLLLAAPGAALGATPEVGEGSDGPSPGAGQEAIGTNGRAVNALPHSANGSSLNADQHQIVHTLLEGEAFSEADRQQWTAAARKVDSPPAAEQFVLKLQVEDALRACPFPSEAQRQSIRGDLRLRLHGQPANSQDCLRALLAQLATVRDAAEAGQLVQRLGVPGQPALSHSAG